ncbi:MAG: hypothetical protein HC798_01030 [Polaribacter sp.]|nr:hypothetical protein [Polaribacter sp.]
MSNTFVGFNLIRKPTFALRLRPNISFVIAQQTISFNRIVIVNRRPQIQTFSYNIFDLLNTQFNLPISLSTKSWDFELGYNTNFPSAVTTESNLPITSLFTFSVGYLIGM